MTVTTADALTGGFADPPVMAARAFRTILDALARPGSILALDGAAPPAPLSPAAGAVLLTLADRTTPLFLAPSHDCAAVRAWVAFHTGAPLVTGAGAAALAVGDWPGLAGLPFAVGTPEYPDRSATLIADGTTLTPSGARLTGPGIDGAARLSLPDPAWHRSNRRLFPLGCDVIYCAGDRIAAVPRSTVVEAA